MRIHKDDDYNKISQELNKIKYLCNCGHKTVIPNWVDRQLCSWCGKWVFKNKKDEFDFRVKEKLNEVARDNKNSL